MINDVWPSIDPGRFRHSITLLKPTTAVGLAGIEISYQQPDIPTTASVEIQYLRGDELVSDGQDISRAYLKATGWYRAEFSAGQRVQTAGGKQYIIQYVENVREMNVYMVLTCLAIGAK